MGSTQKRPNFLVIVADDLGFSDLGAYGSEIATPNLDKLAAQGVRFSNFHTASACSPTRSMLFSGTDNHIAGLGQMMEHMAQHGDYFKDKPGYEGYLNWRVAALSEILQDAGYLNIMSGKWHLGLTKELAPCSRGFDKVFSFLPGSGNHHAYEPQLDSDEFYIPCLNTEGHWMDGDKYINHKTDLPSDFFSTASFTDRLINFWEDRTVEEKQQPFFSYLAFTAPHWPLQASRDKIKKYTGKYDAGPDALTQSRLKNLKKLGIVPPNAEAAPPCGSLGKSWDEMGNEERKKSARAMEIFAAMVETIDDNVGRVLDYLTSTGELDNTFVLFMSDNGAEGAALEALPMMGGEDTLGSIIEKYYDNSLENMGNKDSFIWSPMGLRSSAPLRGFKCWITEGGIRCPCIVRYPNFNIKNETITHSFGTVMDILPTILELAGVPHPGTRFRGRDVVLPRGKSWVTHLASQNLGTSVSPFLDYASLITYQENTSIHGEDIHIHGWELFGCRAIREGPWKAIWMNKPRGKDDWELYNLHEDPSEVNDLSDAEPEILKRLIRHWERYYAETGMVQTPVFAVTKA
ncbi:arylsulfatase [Aspergillus ochraceoroseus]|uniref:Arylsulfatase n=1 Tax=Aspergillus ochraceoroseus TaxID=138278 RepID=A0A0F8V0T9_9EURO|nr:arylsulfatase [Aspergillus ochraceoroseus]